MRWLIVTLFAIVPILVGCGESRTGQFRDQHEQATSELESLEKSLDKGELANARLLKEYAKALRARKPDMSGLLIELEKDATADGPLFQGLRRRLSELEQIVIKDPVMTAELNEGVAEIEAIRSAANPAIFNDALSDTINVIADMSDGELARVNAVSRVAEETSNQTSAMGAGSQFIGNHHYGFWSQGSSGSFWVWYGQYRMFSDLLGPRNYYYNDWARGRGYSYYHDVGRESYTSRKERSSQTQVEQQARKNYKSNKPFQSPYATKRQGASSLSKASVSQSSAVFKSPYANAPKSKYQSSTRNSTSRTSRGTSRGK